MTTNAVMALAAGEGKRMMPLSLDKPKALIAVKGVPILWRALVHFRDFGQIVVNGYHEKERIRRWLAENLPQAEFSGETDRLGSGGGVKNALRLLPNTFFVVNGDSFLDASPVAAMLEAWNPAKMDALLLLHHPRRNAIGYRESGDYSLSDDNRLTRSSREGASAFAGVQILTSGMFASTPKAFPLNLLYERAEAAGRLYGLPHSGWWYHIGDPQALELVESGDDL